MSMEESISLEETNRIRISLGLKPLTDDKAPATDKEKQAEDNYAKQREREAKDREAKYVSFCEPLCRVYLYASLFQVDPRPHCEVSNICLTVHCICFYFSWPAQAVSSCGKSVMLIRRYL